MIIQKWILLQHELQEATDKHLTRKAPGTDEMPTECFKAAAEETVKILRNIMAWEF